MTGSFILGGIRLNTLKNSPLFFFLGLVIMLAFTPYKNSTYDGGTQITTYVDTFEYILIVLKGSSIITLILLLVSLVYTKTKK